MLLGDFGVRSSRKPEIMGDAAYAIITRSNNEVTGQFLVDDDVLGNEGITDFESYSNVPGDSINHMSGRSLIFGLFIA